jgi:hypothetical protein
MPTNERIKARFLRLILIRIADLKKQRLRCNRLAHNGDERGTL